MPITKHNYIVKDVRKLAGIVREAFKIAKSGRPGPVLVDIPKDVQLALAEYDPAAPDEAPESPALRQDDFDRAVELIRESQRPFLYAGGGVVISNATEELIELSKRLYAPIGSSIMGLTAVPQSASRR
jgi:acetolactate synthase-1/2/3 large subunit